MESELPELNTGTNWPKIILIGMGVLFVMVVLGALLSAPAPPFSQKPASKDSKDAQKSVLDDVPKYTPPTQAGYVGSARCAGCHEKIAESFKQHPMANSASLLDEKSITPDQLQQTRVAGKQRVLDVELHDGVLEHHERMFDEEGKQIYDQAVPMKLSVGSGRRAKAFVHQRGDAQFMSPLNWYSQAKKWDLAPNYKPDDDRRFDRRVTDECLSCHTGRLNPLGRSLNRFQEPAFHELSIGCENCHGPGEQHVKFREENGTGKDHIINPSRLDPDRRESVCNQCHLQTAVRTPRYLRSHLDFRPGQNAEEIWTFLDTQLGVSKDGRTRSVNHVQQMRSSRCFEFSEQRMGCTSCHDPHRVPAPAERAAFYRERCSKCHQDGDCDAPREERQKEQDSCIACHMPTRDSKNISHVTQTDHRVLRDPRKASETKSESDEEELKLLKSPAVPLVDWEEERALTLGAWIYLTKADRTPPEALAKSMLRVLYKVPEDPDTLLALGSLALQFKLFDRAMEYSTRGRSIPAAEEESLGGLLNVYYQGNAWDNALEVADSLLKIIPGDAKTHALRAEVLRKLNRIPEGIKSAERAVELNPTLIPVREWLIEAYRETNQADALQAQEEIVKRMRTARIPTTPPAKAD